MADWWLPKDEGPQWLKHIAYRKPTGSQLLACQATTLTHMLTSMEERQSNQVDMAAGGSLQDPVSVLPGAVSSMGNPTTSRTHSSQQRMNCGMLLLWL